MHCSAHSVLNGLVQQAVDTLPPQDLGHHKKVREAILQTLNLSPEAYHQCLCEIEFGLDYHPQLIGQCIWATCLRRLGPENHTKKEIIEAICVEMLFDCHPRVY